MDNSFLKRKNSLKDSISNNGRGGFINKLVTDIRTLSQFSENEIKWKNSNNGSAAYQPTNIEHIANIVTHGFWIFPAAYAFIVLITRSQSSDQLFVAVVYGLSLFLLFCSSTAFHITSYLNQNLLLKEVLHRFDRAMIYVFISSSYYPWLTITTSSNVQTKISALKWFIWVSAFFGISYQQLFHEKYKSLETIFYLIHSIGPAFFLIVSGVEFPDELKIGGIFYLVGVFFFKSDGKLSCSHAIWHVFVVFGSSIHYFAILKHLYNEQMMIHDT